MKSERASKTAEHNAFFRALEARRPPNQRVVDDQLAEPFLPLRFKLATVPARWGRWRDLAARIIDRRWPGVRSTVIARTRLIDSLVGELALQLPQAVILGAGFDTRAWRLPELRDVAVFEVDHPATQRRKQQLLHRRDLDTAHVRFIPTDFILRQLDTTMSEAGFDAALPTLFLWEGTTNYLSAEAVDATLRWCAGAAAGSHLIFTYINADVLMDPSAYVGADQLFSSLRRVEEPLTFGLDPDKLDGYLGERGLSLISDEGAASIRQRCLLSVTLAEHALGCWRQAG